MLYAYLLSVKSTKCWVWNHCLLLSSSGADSTVRDGGTIAMVKEMILREKPSHVKYTYLLVCLVLIVSLCQVVMAKRTRKKMEMKKWIQKKQLLMELLLEITLTV